MPGEKEQLIKSVKTGKLGLGLLAIGAIATLGSWGEAGTAGTKYLGPVFLALGLLHLLQRQRMVERLQPYPAIQFRRANRASAIAFLPLLIISLSGLDRSWPSSLSYSVVGFMFLMGLFYYTFYNKLPSSLR